MSLALSWRRSLSYTFSRCLENSENECNIKNITTYGTERLKTYFNFSRFIQKQPSTGAFIKKCPENMQQIYRRTPMPKGDFQKVVLQIYWNHTSAWMFSCNLLHIFRTPLYKNTFWGKLLSLQKVCFKTSNSFYRGRISLPSILITEKINPQQRYHQNYKMISRMQWTAVKSPFEASPLIKKMHTHDSSRHFSYMIFNYIMDKRHFVKLMQIFLII